MKFVGIELDQNKVFALFKQKKIFRFLIGIVIFGVIAFGLMLPSLPIAHYRPNRVFTTGCGPSYPVFVTTSNPAYHVNRSIVNSQNDVLRLRGGGSEENRPLSVEKENLNFGVDSA